MENTESLGWDIIQFTKKYEGTDKYDDIMLAIEFGYQSALKHEQISVESALKEALGYGLDYGYNQGFADATNESAYEDLDIEEVFTEYKKQL